MGRTPNSLAGKSAGERRAECPTSPGDHRDAVAQAFRPGNSHSCIQHFPDRHAAANSLVRVQREAAVLRLAKQTCQGIAEGLQRHSLASLNTLSVVD